MNRLEQIALEHGLCTCDEAYTKRGLTAPDCPWHAFAVQEAMEAYATEVARQADLPDFLKCTAYTDVDRDVDYEKEMPHKEWPSIKYIARKVSSEPCIDPLAPYQVTVTVQIDQFDNVTLTCPAGHAFSAKSEGMADFFSRDHFKEQPK